MSATVIQPGEGREPLALITALRMLDKGLWPIPIYGPEMAVENAGKRPIGEAWGCDPHTAETLRALWARYPTASLGLKLGKDGGVIDIEIDDREKGEASLVELLGGECVETMGWTSHRGDHLLFKWDDRLTRYVEVASVLKGNRLPGLPGIEIRLGASPDDPNQVQSVCPPSLMTTEDKSGRIISLGPRCWNAVREIADLPSSFFATLDRILFETPKVDPPKTSLGIFPPPSGGIEDARHRYAMGALDAEIRSVEAAPQGTRNDRLNTAAFSIGTLVGSKALSLAVAWAALENAARLAGLGDKETLATLRSGFNAGQEKPRDLSRVTVTKGEAFVSSLKPADTGPASSLDEIATAADLVLAQAGIEWVWDGWIQKGVLTLLAAEPGVGKTRLCLDLCRRIYLNLPWPDGQAMNLPPGSSTLWVPADNNHAELADVPGNFGFVPEAIYLNTSKSDLYGGTELTTAEQLGRFEFHIRCVRPALVIIDTITNTSDYKSHDTSDAKKQYKPLQEIAKRTGTPIVCVTHLNAAGKTVGRRADEKVRTAIRLERPDPEGQPNRRKLWVTKSNSLVPAPLGITMGAEGNEYDLDPPQAPDDPKVFVGPGGATTERLAEAMEWLREQLQCEPVRVSDLRRGAEAAGFSTKTLYKARDRAGAYEIEAEGRKYWQLTPGEPF